MKTLVKQLKKLFEVTDMGEPSKILGIEVTQDGNTITIQQTQYLEKILRKYGMENANPVRTPLDPKTTLEKNPDQGDNEIKNLFQSMLGSLQYLSIATRPDITYAINRLGTYMQNPSHDHYNALKRVLRYLAGTRKHGITYGRTDDEGEHRPFHGYADAAYANADDFKSTTGYTFLSSGGAITWGSKKQNVVALSSTEAEYVALSEAGKEALWLRSLYDELGFKSNRPITIYGDNDGSITLAKNPIFHKRSKHIAIRWHWMRQYVESGEINIRSC